MTSSEPAWPTIPVGQEWKLERDPYLAPVARRWGERAAFEAGYFLDDDPDDAPLDDVHTLCTPTEHVRTVLAAGVGQGRRPIVLVAAGALFPLHDGHLAMMEQARARTEQEGWWVAGGYLSAGHDHYLGMKWGEAAAPASSRIGAIATACAPTGWLAADPWEAQLRRTSVNYTDVVARLQAYLRHHLRSDIDVAFVCGADNARFSLAFALAGPCIVVDRPGWEIERDRWRADPRVAAADDRILWAAGDHVGASSNLTPTPPQPSAHRLRLRLEDERAVRAIGLDPDRWERFQLGLVELLRRSGTVQTVSMTDEVPGPTDGVLSLDPMWPGEADLGISRLFDLGGHHQLGHVARPGHPPLDDQIAALGPGPWTLRDDDAATGGTITFVRSLVDVDRVGTTLPPTSDDIADSRDFLLGTDDGGLVVALPDGTVGRAPYLLPFVDPAARGTVAPDQSVAFSLEAWRLNEHAFNDTNLTVDDLPAYAAAALTAAGHKPSTTLSDVARHYVALLSTLDAVKKFEDVPNMTSLDMVEHP